MISAVVFAIAMLAYNAGYLNVERLSKLMGIPGLRFDRTGREARE